MNAVTRMRSLWVGLGVVFHVAYGAPPEQSPSRSPVHAVLAQLGDGFVSLFFLAASDASALTGPNQPRNLLPGN